MSPTTVPISAPSNECPYCGAIVPPRASHCPDCHQSLQTPDMLDDLDRTNLTLSTPFSDQTRVALTFPSAAAKPGTTVTLHIPNMVIMGRTLGPGPAEVFDLTRYSGLQQGVSRRHCMLRRYTDRLVVIDLGSANGTFRNDEKLTPRQEYVIADGDTLTLGKLTLTVHFTTG